MIDVTVWYTIVVGTYRSSIPGNAKVRVTLKWLEHTCLVHQGTQGLV
jgi:hypothetical protein